MAITRIKSSNIEDGTIADADLATDIDAGKLINALPALDGSNLTGIAPTKTTVEALGIELPAANLTGSIAGARLPDPLPAIDGSSLTNLPAVTVGLATIWVPAVAMYPTTTAGCDAVAQVETGAGPPPTPELKTLDFADGADKYAQFSIAMPKSWDESTITFQTYWSVAGTNTGTVGFTLSAVSLSSDEVCTTGFGTAVANTPLAASGTISDLMVNAVSGAVTVGGTPAVGDQVFFQVLRDVSEDTQTSPARLHGIKIFFTTDAENDD